jgi:hypothetical protein
VSQPTSSMLTGAHPQMVVGVRDPHDCAAGLTLSAVASMTTDTEVRRRVESGVADLEARKRRMSFLP